MLYATNVQDNNITVAFCVELKMKAAPFQVELYCKLWIWGASSRGVYPGLCVVGRVRRKAFLSKKKKKKAHACGLWPTLLAPCECFIQHQVVNKIKIRIKMKFGKKTPFDRLNCLIERPDALGTKSKTYINSTNEPTATHWCINQMVCCAIGSTDILNKG